MIHLLLRSGKDATFPLVCVGDSHTAEQASLGSVQTHERLDPDSLASFHFYPSLIILIK